MRRCQARQRLDAMAIYLQHIFLLRQARQHLGQGFANVRLKSKLHESEFIRTCRFDFNRMPAGSNLFGQWRQRLAEVL